MASPDKKSTTGSAARGAEDGLPAASNLAFVEAIYADWLRDRGSVPEAWGRFFREMGAEGRPVPPAERPFPRRSVFDPGPGPRALRSGRLTVLQDRVDQLVRAYRVRGHRIAAVDPLGLPVPDQPELEPSYYGFEEADLDVSFSCDTIPGMGMCPLREILDHLRDTYCRSIGVQYMHIDSREVRDWLRERMESTRNRIQLTRHEQMRILDRLTRAVVFEEFLQKKFLGSKSFSLEGAETLIPLLDTAIESAAANGVEEVVLAMAHRGRLNVLANLMCKPVRSIFKEFEDPPADPGTGGDVKYHLGCACEYVTEVGRSVKLSLSFNPSHLEFVNPVALGRVRARQERMGGVGPRRCLGILVHGDASFAGEGIVQECLNLSEIPGYRVGGTVHVVVNNQIGFTTTPEEGRSSTYATDVARMLQIPIFHVNGEDPEAVCQVVRLAMDFRDTFRRDVVIDMYCYRRRGHNEMDEPRFTQPVMYRAIDQRPSTRQGYLEHLMELGGVDREEADAVEEACRRQLEEALGDVRSGSFEEVQGPAETAWDGYHGGPATGVREPVTAMAGERLAELLGSQTHLPHDFQPHRKIGRLLDRRREMAGGDVPLDWGAAEALALASLVVDGVPVRLSGQDTARGTFSHRHAVLHDAEDGRPYVPLAHLAPDQARVDVLNSPLSEAGALGFEYGYSLGAPEALVIWEAQYGDFVNAAQVIIDQFLVSAEEKWSRLSGLVLFLPHGYEGQGPEHSSARLERFLMLAAKDNIQVAQPSTPAQLFHLMRRQALLRWRKPLVVLTPKSLLRRKETFSPLEDLAQGRFRPVLGDPEVPGRGARRVLLCSGKVAYDLLDRRNQLEAETVTVLRLEQLYPFPAADLERALEEVPEGVEVVWVQDEPANMGAWSFLCGQYPTGLFGRFPLRAVHRPEAASPATGSPKAHAAEQELLLKEAFAGI